MNKSKAKTIGVFLLGAFIGWIVIYMVLLLGSAAAAGAATIFVCGLPIFALIGFVWVFWAIFARKKD